VQHEEWIRIASTAAVVVMLGILDGCHQKASPLATPADVASAQQEAQQSLADIANVTITCTTSAFTVGGTIAGLATGGAGAGRSWRSQESGVRSEVKHCAGK